MKEESMFETIRNELAPKGVLRAAINLSNFLLVTRVGDDGIPYGVSPDMATALAEQLDVPVEFVTFKTVGEISDVALDDIWDIANIGAEPERAKVIDFSEPYCEIEATYLLPPGSTIQSIEEVDQTGNRIAVYARAAYGLWLIDNVKHAELIKTASADEALEKLSSMNLDALAGLRPRLVTDVETLPGARILEGQFTAVRQSMGCQKGLQQGAKFVHEFIEQAVSSGMVAELIEKHGVEGRLSVAAR